jgi:hypothetical protein
MHATADSKMDRLLRGRTACSPVRSVAAVCDHVARRGCVMEGARVDDPCLGGVLRLPRLALPGWVRRCTGSAADSQPPD